jgi:hypothetical protein
VQYALLAAQYAKRQTTGSKDHQHALLVDFKSIAYESDINSYDSVTEKSFDTNKAPARQQQKWHLQGCHYLGLQIGALLSSVHQAGHDACNNQDFNLFRILSLGALEVSCVMLECMDGKGSD